MRSFSSVILLSIACAVVRAANPLSGCSAGTAVQNTQALTTQGVCGYGLPTSSIGSWAASNVAAVSEAFFSNGQRCGQCFEVVGPLGSVVVTVTNYCPKDSDPRCNNPGKAHFILSSDAYSKIANTTTDFVINDLGYRQVSCPVTGDASVNFPQVSSTYFFSILPYNARIAISTVEVKGNSWSRYEFATRDTNSAKFSWNKNANGLTFPFNLRLTANTGEKLVVSVPTLTAGASLTIGAQFADVPELAEDCRLGVASPVLYSAGLGLGNNWDDSYSFALISKTIETATDNSLHAVMGAYGAVQFTRSGGFDTVYWSSLNFTAKASYNGYDKLRVYLGTDTSNAVSIGPMTTDYATYTVGFASFTEASAVQPSVVIQNNDPNTVDVYFTQVVLTRNSVPADAAPLPTTGLVTYTTTANPPGTLGGPTAGPGNGDDGVDSESNSNSSSATSTTISVALALLVLCACMF